MNSYVKLEVEKGIGFADGGHRGLNQSSGGK